MEKILIYHNPRWGKSRESVKILDNLGKKYEVLDYINFPPTKSELISLSDKLGIKAKDFIRNKESIFKELELKDHMENDDFLFEKMSENPKLIERPIIVKGDRAILGRPPEILEDFLNNDEL